MKLFSLFRPSPAPESPLGLTREQIHLLGVLKNTEEWGVYLEALARLVNIESEVLLSSQDAYHDTLRKGILLGLRRAASLVDEILTKAEQNEQQRNRAEQRREYADSIRKFALYGTPAWPAWSQR